MARCLLQFGVVVLVVGQVALSRGQVFDPPASQSNVGVQQAGGTAVAAPVGAVEQTAWGIPMPKITLPKMTMPKISMPSMSSVTGPVKSGFGKVSEGTRKAWEGTKEILSFGNNETTSTTINRAVGPEKPSFWAEAPRQRVGASGATDRWGIHVPATARSVRKFLDADIRENPTLVLRGESARGLLDCE